MTQNLSNTVINFHQFLREILKETQRDFCPRKISSQTSQKKLEIRNEKPIKKAMMNIDENR